MSFLDLFSDKADLYASARPTYPAALFEWIAAQAPARGRAWDCGTGSGQAAIDLARHFMEVEATDPSAEQIKNAVASPRVRYSVQAAEQVAFPDAHFDVVCVAQAMHWFELDPFYAQVKRVLRPGGVLAAWGYDWMEIDPAFDAQFQRSILDVVQPYWSPRLKRLWEGYRDVPFPFEERSAPPFQIEAHWSFPQFLAYIHTWSGVRRCMDAQGTAFFTQAEEALAPLWGAPERPRVIVIPLHLRVGRTPAGG